MTDYELDIIYDPRRYGIMFFQRLYDLVKLETPSEETLRTPFHGNKNNSELCITKVSPLKKETAREISNKLVEMIGMGIEEIRIKSLEN